MKQLTKVRNSKPRLYKAVPSQLPQTKEIKFESDYSDTHSNHYP